jgi:hypothetical protein
MAAWPARDEPGELAIGDVGFGGQPGRVGPGPGGRTGAERGGVRAGAGVADRPDGARVAADIGRRGPAGAGNPGRRQHGELGRDPVTGYVLSQTDFLGRTTTFQRDALGYVTSEAPPSAVWTWWNAPMFFLAALLALTTEWVLRKQKNLV